MDLGYHGKLFLLACDHRSGFRAGMFGIADRPPTPAERERLADAKSLVWEGFQAALAAGAPVAATGILVDEETGAAVARAAREQGILLAMPVEASGRAVFDFEYGEEFGDHLAAFDPGFAKALVRWNPADDPGARALQAQRLRRLTACLQEQGRKFLLELLVLPTAHQLALAGGDTGAYDAHQRPQLMLEAIAQIQEAGIEPDIWKIEGIDTSAGCRLVSARLRRDGRDHVKAVVLGRGADEETVGRWLRTAAGVPGYAGFAIGRSIWWDEVAAWKEGTRSRALAAAGIGAAYRRFMDEYEGVAR